MVPSIKVLIVDDHPVVREGLAHILAECPDIELSGEAGDAEEALAKAAAAGPDVVLMDVRLPGMDGIQAAQQLKQVCLGVRVVLMSAFAEQYVAQAMEVGAQDILSKNIKKEELVLAIRGAYLGQSTLKQFAAERLLALGGLHKRFHLSQRQQEMIRLVASGTPNKEIAQTLHLSETTIKRELRSIFDKLGAVDRAEAVSLAHRHGLL